MPIYSLGSAGGSGTLTAASIIAALGYTPAAVGAPSFYDFTAGVVPAGLTFTRASAGWRYNSSGVLVSETTDVARFQYEPSTLAARGLLIEDASSGLFTYSEQFDNAAWTKTRVTVVANTVAAPDGTTTADTLVEDSSPANSHFVQQTPSFVSGTTYAFSVFCKADTRSHIQIIYPAGAFGAALRTWFDVGGGTVGTTGAGCTAFIHNVGGGWYRCVVICTATASSAGNFFIALASADGITTYTGDGTSGLYLWGANMRADDRVTSYVQVVASPVVRAADVGLITNANALADQCWIVKGRTPRKIASGAINIAFQADDGTANNRRVLRYGTDSRLHLIATVGGIDQCDLDMGAVAANTDFAIAVRWADNNFAASLNGAAIVTDVSGSNPLGLTTARVGRGATGSYWNSTLRTIKTQPTAADSELPLLAA
jgi:hypothetical protein